MTASLPRNSAGLFSKCSSRMPPTKLALHQSPRIKLNVNVNCRPLPRFGLGTHSQRSYFIGTSIFGGSRQGTVPLCKAT